METYDEIYRRMSEKYTAESGFEIDPSSDIAIRLRVLAGEIYNAGCSLDWLKRQMFADTATGETLEKLVRLDVPHAGGIWDNRGSVTVYIVKS